jgi:pimeloyl-ACP methyl ester carboxylesterase
MKPNIKLAIVVLAGFSQKLGETIGMSSLYWKLRSKYATAPTHFVIEQTWDGAMDQLARKLARNCARSPDGTPRMKLIVAAYSWGCGNALNGLAKELASLGMSIDLACLVDPVPKRPGWFVSPRQLYALTRWGKFALPANVMSAQSWRTMTKRAWNSPVGREVEPPVRETVFVKEKPAEAPSNWTVVTDPMVYHDTIDDNPLVHVGIMRTIREMVE